MTHLSTALAELTAELTAERAEVDAALVEAELRVVELAQAMDELYGPLPPPDYQPRNP